MPSVKCLDLVEASSAALYFPIEEGINQAIDINKARKS